MSKLSNIFKQYRFAAMAAFLLATFCAAQQPTAKAPPRPPRPESRFRVTRAILRATVSGGAGGCPKTVTFNGAITTNGAADVKYTWVSMDGGTWPEHVIKFSKAGTEKVTESRSAPSNQTGWMQIKVVSPNAFLSPRANYRVLCVTAHKK